MGKASATAACAALIFTLPLAAGAQPLCLSRALIVERLQSTYAEQLVSRGLQGDTQLFEVFMSRDGASWTIIKTLPTGVSCVMAAGTDWQLNDPGKVFAVEG